MKNYKSFVIAILGIVSMVSICQAVPVEWVRQSDSPVLDTGGEGASPYESYHVSYPSVLIQDEIYKMWYAGYRAGPSPRGGICYATSEDKGLTWTKHGTVLEVTEEWEQNSPPETYNYVNYPRVIYEEGMYKMWYNATGPARGYATSTDGNNWDNKTQQLGHGYAYAEVVKGPSDYKLYYNKSGGIYVMESSDGGVSDPWEVANQDNPVLELGGLGEWDSLAVLQPNVRYDPGTGKFQMWYRGSATPSLVPSKIGFALSDDGLTWEKCLANPILEPIAGTWERDAVWPGSTVFDHTDNTYRMFYGGYHFDHQAIGLAAAVSPEPAGPVAYWSFDDVSNPGHDDSGNGHNGTVIDAQSADGICGKALYFDGNGDYVEVPDDDALDPTSTQEITIAGWVNLPTYQAQNSSVFFGIVGKTAIVRPNGSYLFGIWNDGSGFGPGKLMFGVPTGNNATYQFVNSNSLVSLNQWVHVAVTHDSSNITKIYINGQVDITDSSAITQAFENNNKDLSIGYSGRYADYFYGSMDEVRIYDRALSESEIAELVVPCDPIEEILDFIDDSIDANTLEPIKEGKPGEGQLGALINMIEAAGNLIDAELLAEVCWQLQDALEKTDGLSPPESAPDFVAGEAAVELASKIQELMESLGCN